MRGSFQKRLLVTGASGFVGWHVVRAAQPQWDTVGVGYRQWVPLPAGPLARVDLSRPEQLASLLALHPPDAVIHAAAWARGDRCQQQPQQSHQANVVASRLLAEACAAARIPLVLVSTDLVFDGHSAPYDEQSEPKPVSVYGQHKLEAERAVQLAWPRATVCRLPLVFGPPAPAATGFLTPLATTLTEGHSAKLFVDEFRTPLSVDDAAQALLLALDYPGRLLHFPGPQRVSRYELGQLVAELLGADPRQIVASRQAEGDFAAPRPPDVSLASRHAATLGFQTLPLRDGLRQALQAGGWRWAPGRDRV